jgi:hypothetical protein
MQICQSVHFFVIYKISYSWTPRIQLREKDAWYDIFCLYKPDGVIHFWISAAHNSLNIFKVVLSFKPYYKIVKTVED